MPVDRVRVVGVALRFVAHGGPLRDESNQEAVLVEGLDLVDGGVTEGEQGDEGRTGLRRPGVARIGHDVGQTVEGGLGDGPVELGGGGGEAKGQRGVLGDRRQRREGHLAVDQDHVGPELGALLGSRLTVLTPAEAMTGRGRGVPEPASPPHVVADPGDLTAGVGHGRHEVVGIGQAEGGRDLVLILKEQPVVGTACDSVQLDPDGGQKLGRPRE